MVYRAVLYELIFHKILLPIGAYMQNISSYGIFFLFFFLPVKTKCECLVPSARPVMLYPRGATHAHHPKPAKRSTFSHKVGQKLGFCRRDKGVGFQKVRL